MPRRKGTGKKPAVRTLHLDDIRFIQTRALEENSLLQQQQEQELAEDDETMADVHLPQRSAKDYQLLNMVTREPFGGKSSFDCWWCSHPFETAKVGIVVAKDVRRNTYYMFGNFCDWPCAISYSETRYKLKHDCKKRRVWIRQLYTKPPWNIEGRVRPAPDPVILKRKGGIMTLAQFRAYGYQNMQKSIRLVMPTDELHYNLVGLAPAFQIQERRERDLMASRHSDYKALLDKHIPDDTEETTTAMDVDDANPMRRQRRRNVRGRASEPATSRKKPKLMSIVAPESPQQTPSSSNLLRFLHARQQQDTTSK